MAEKGKKKNSRFSAPEQVIRVWVIASEGARWAGRLNRTPMPISFEKSGA